ncbi:tyrosine-type recombinase/integrase [Flavobacterium sp.]
MSSILKTLHQINDLVYDSVYGFDFNFHYIAEYLGHFSKLKTMSKTEFSIPKIYTGGVEIENWGNLSIDEQSEALKKDWYIYYSFRSPETGLLKRQTPIKGNANTFKTKKDRYTYLSVMRKNLENLLNNGTSPYINNDFTYLDDLINKSSEKETKKTTTTETKLEKEKVEDVISIKEAFEITLKLKKNVMNETSFGNYQLRIKKFMNFLPDAKAPITSISKKDVVKFLITVLESTSPRNRNNYRTDLNSFFNELENNDYIENNFIAKINVLKSTPERNKTFSDVKQVDIYNYLERNDALLLLFIQFISYNFLRPVEVCRLKIKDIDIIEKILHVRAKNQPIKIKIIPDILLNELPDFTGMNHEHYLFTPNGFGMGWDAKENNRRDYFSKRFNEVVKKKFNLNQDFGLYSFRHTFITKLYRKLRITNSPQIAKGELMLITGHKTITALDKYLRDIDAELPQDYSHLLQ